MLLVAVTLPVTGT